MQNFLLNLLQGILETTGVISFSLALARVPLRWGRILSLGVLLTLVIQLIRSMPLTFGLHMVAGLLLLIIIITKTTTVPPTRVFMSVFTSLTALALLEMFFHETLLRLMQLDPETIMSQDVLWFLVGIPQCVLLTSAAVLIARKIKPSPGAWKL